MAIEVDESIERMKIILSDRRPFEYRRNEWGNPIEYPSLSRDTKDLT